jgi:hypothetical protein
LYVSKQDDFIILNSVKQGVPEEKDANSSNGESAQPDYKDPWEECGCILWDLAASKPQAELMVRYQYLITYVYNRLLCYA